jgi:hypothetical protein
MAPDGLRPGVVIGEEPVECVVILPAAQVHRPHEIDFERFPPACGRRRLRGFHVGHDRCFERDRPAGGVAGDPEKPVFLFGLPSVNRSHGPAGPRLRRPHGHSRGKPGKERGRGNRPGMEVPQTVRKRPEHARHRMVSSVGIPARRAAGGIPATYPSLPRLPLFSPQ